MMIEKEYGKFVFSDSVMKERLDSDCYHRFKAVRGGGKPLTGDVADHVAEAMKTWALENGATHYTHWFIPLTGLSAGKHEAFLSGIKDDRPICSFSGQMLIKGEGDASSFPSGGLRATFECRGYTAWDPTSPAFILGTTLYIPTAFYSYHGEALDQKTPLLRSMQAVGAAAVRLLRLLGDGGVKSVKATAGAEQEYFLIDRDYYTRRLDLMVTGRTLFGARPPKGQELGDHYYSRIRTRVMAFMEDLDKTLWTLGVPSKTRHNETAPAQYEVAAIFSTANIALDHNQLLMQVIRSIARKHNFGCLLHEKPFDGVNGSGKHNNWSLATDAGENLFSPGENPAENIRFLLFLSAVIRAADMYGDLIRLSASSHSNDLRLGGYEAPPPIISLFLGEHLTSLLRDIAEGKPARGTGREKLSTGLSSLPSLDLDDSDRNRTSPLAFTGNKFEFRMVGSSQSVGFPNTVLNTAVADSLCYIADHLEGAPDASAAAREMIGTIYSRHARIIFNGDNYTEDWRKEAKTRGLPAYLSASDTIPVLLYEKNIRLFENAGVLSKAELGARYEIMLNNYVNITLIECGTMTEMARREIIPASVGYAGSVAKNERALETAGHPSGAVKKLLSRLVTLTDGIDSALSVLAASVEAVNREPDLLKKAELCRGIVIPGMQALRTCCDEAEQLFPGALWPVPNYMEMLYQQ